MAPYIFVRFTWHFIYNVWKLCYIFQRRPKGSSRREALKALSTNHNKLSDTWRLSNSQLMVLISLTLLWRRLRSYLTRSLSKVKNESSISFCVLRTGFWNVLYPHKNDSRLKGPGLAPFLPYVTATRAWRATSLARDCCGGCEWSNCVIDNTKLIIDNTCYTLGLLAYA